MHLVHLHPSRDTPQQCWSPIMAEVITGPHTQNPEHVTQHGLIKLHRRGHLLLRLLCDLQAPHAVAQRNQPRRHLLDRQDSIDQPRINRAARHVGMFSLGRILHDHEPALLLDSSQSDRAIGPRPRQQYADPTASFP